MKTLELLRGLYTELKRFNDNAERQMQINEKKGVEARQPNVWMTLSELQGFKHWIKTRLQAQGIDIKTYDWGRFCCSNEVEKFLCVNSARVHKPEVTKALCAALGYDNILSLVADWRRGAKAGAA